MTPSVTAADVKTALKAWVEGALTGVTVYETQVNQVAEPNAADFIMMTAMRRERLTVDTRLGWDTSAPEPDALTFTTPTAVHVAFDVYGPESEDNAQVLAMLWRSFYAADRLPAAVAPLDASDPAQRVLVNAEKNYEARWSVDLRAQINPTVSTPADFADSLAVDIQTPADTGAA